MLAYELQKIQRVFYFNWVFMIRKLKFGDYRLYSEKKI
jgi:hypothetical protein